MEYNYSSISSPFQETSSMGIEDLAGVLIQCFSLILMGYLSGRFNLISEVESRGLSSFVSIFSLPALIFTSIATTSLSDICWSFVSGIFVAKSLIFVLVAGISLFLVQSSDRISSAGLYAIFCTQSNDFAVGYPIINSLYCDTASFSKYLYVLAPVQLLILNPVGIFMMEIQKHNHHFNSDESNNRSSLIVPVIKGVFKNPIIIMTIFGLIWNLAFSHFIPVMISSGLKVLSESFSATALFLLGLNMVGKFHLIQSGSKFNLMLPIVLVAVKILVLPLVIWFILEYVTYRIEDPVYHSLSSFGFLYGTFPAAPTVFIFGLQYNLNIDVVATGMVLSTLLSAPLLFVCANVIRMESSESKAEASHIKDLASTEMFVSFITIPLIAWTLIVFITGQKWKSITHRPTIILCCCQLLNSVGCLHLEFHPDRY